MGGRYVRGKDGARYQQARDCQQLLQSLHLVSPASGDFVANLACL